MIWELNSLLVRNLQSCDYRHHQNKSTNRPNQPFWLSKILFIQR